ncbi:MAG: DUF1080 domain-containing protein [Hymenobacter sp.]
MKHLFLFSLALVGSVGVARAQQAGKPEDTEVWSPEPKVVTPGKTSGDPPTDALVLFDGKNLDQWTLTSDHAKAADWLVKGDILTVNKKSGNIETKRSFGNYQLHIEWRVPANITGTAQARGNSGVSGFDWRGRMGYELQILDAYNNKTYVNGMAGSIYKQLPPLVNPARPPGQWQTYDVVWTAPTFAADGLWLHPARVTVFFNGVLRRTTPPCSAPRATSASPNTSATARLPSRFRPTVIRASRSASVIFGCANCRRGYGAGQRAPAPRLPLRKGEGASG